ncbi:hypothetical protein [Herbiconiux sp. L3-i23]|uniref:hypothetical protein n=1 Tax=Herbiconiux sp. L3-i23 TaxID=2905871 RepID=UPI00206C8C90|nr:hypothetical protein [Herbiconiux sp. L3-i23]BDI23539.1 hypothetical protein L3i23_23150 [Herbiconiux sp. L3-i23]
MSEIRDRVAEIHAERAAAQLRADERQQSRTLDEKGRRARGELIRAAAYARLAPPVEDENEDDEEETDGRS